MAFTTLNVDIYVDQPHHMNTISFPVRSLVEVTAIAAKGVERSLKWTNYECVDAARWSITARKLVVNTSIGKKVDTSVLVARKAKVGDEMLLKGLANRRDLNGHFVKIVEAGMTTEGKWLVKLADETNLVCVSADKLVRLRLPVA